MTRRVWILLFAVVAVAFAILGFFGREVYRHAPPVPERVVSADGTGGLPRPAVRHGNALDRGRAGRGSAGCGTGRASYPAARRAQAGA